MSGVFITGGTGYLGQRLVPLLLAKGLPVRVLVRPGSERKVPPGAELVPGDALDGHSFAGRVQPAATMVHLVGVSHPAPWKARLFRTVDLASVSASLDAARSAGVRHFVYVSVAHPAPVMKAYVAVREECEALVRRSGLDATVLRPWYVVGPGHRWPCVLQPAYWIAERIPWSRAAAQRLGLVSLREMSEALLWAVLNPASGVRVFEVIDIRRGRL